MVGGIDADREAIHGLAHPRKLVELRHQLRHTLPEVRRLCLRDAGVPDEAPQLPVTVGPGRLASGDFEVVEVPRQLVVVKAPLDADVEHPCGAAVETLLDRPHSPGPHHLHQPGLVEHLDVVGDVVVRGRGVANHGPNRLTLRNVPMSWINRGGGSGMTEVVLYHHVQGLTEGVRSFADALRQAGHTVHTPDLFDGRTFDTIEEGMAFAREAGFGALADRGLATAEGIGPEAVYAGFSFGVMVAQQLAQTRPGAGGALLMSACLPVSEFGDAWPEGIPAQVHGKDADREA